VRVRDVVAELRTFAADFTNLSHDKLQILNCSGRPRSVQTSPRELYTQEKAGGSIEANITLAPKLQFSPSGRFLQQAPRDFSANQLTSTAFSK
jgi:hypothetical protein